PNRPPLPDELITGPALDLVRPQALAERGQKLVAAVSRLPRSPELEVFATLLEGSAHRVQPRDDVDADGQVQRIGIGGQSLVKPSARQIEHVAGLEDAILNGLARPTQLRRIALVLERKLEQGLVDEPALATGHLENEDVVGVVVNG